MRKLIFAPLVVKTKEVICIPAAASEKQTILLIFLCVLTIIGSVFTIGRAYLYEMVSMMDGHSNYFRGWIYAGSAIGTLIGAIMMTQRN